MDPNVRIRNWILACGEQYGIREAHYIRWADAPTRQEEMYCTYQLEDYKPAQVGLEPMNTKSSTTATFSAEKKHHVRVRVDLYNSENGAYELATFGIAAQHCPLIHQIFDGTCGYLETEVVKDDTTADDERLYHHQYAVYLFEVNVQYQLSETNGVVTDILINTESGSPSYNIDTDGITNP